MSSRNLDQDYYRFAKLPYLELRRTEFSRQHYKPHSHQQLSIGAILAGSTQVHYQGKFQTAKQGDLVIINPEQVHYCNPAAGDFRSYYMLYLDSQWCKTKFAALFYLKENCRAEGNQEIDEQRKSHQEEISPQERVLSLSQENSEQVFCPSMTLKDPELFQNYLTTVDALLSRQLTQAEQRLEQLVFELFSRHFSLPQKQQPEHALTQQCRRHLLADLAAAISIEQIAQQLDCRTETLIRQFKRDTGISPKAFLNNARIEQGKLLLKQGYNQADVALAVGFSDQSHFHKAFVNFTSATPGQYQKVYSSD